MAAKVGNTIRQHSLLLAAIAATIAVYWQVTGFRHISWDDPEMVFANVDVKSFNLKNFFTGHYVGNYLPLTMLVHALTWQLFENNDAAHHVLNLLVHLVNGALVYFLSLKLFREKTYAVLGACFFLLHPLQTESVAWISELKNLLYALFFLSGLLFYGRYLLESNSKLYLASLFLFVLACLCKPSAVVFPLVMVCVDLLVAPRRIFYLLKNKIPFLLLALVFGLINLYTQGEDRFINYAHAYPMYQRIALAGLALFKYFQLFIFPAKLSVIYPYPSPDTATLVAGAFALSAILLTLFFLIRKKQRSALALVLFVVFNLILVLQLIPFGEVLYADRYMYLAIPGFAWMLSAGIVRLKIDHRIFGAALLVILSLLSYSRVSKWKNAITLYEDILKKYPDNFVALNSAGVEHMFLGNDRKAREYLYEATRIAPRNYKGHYNLGLLYLKLQDPDRAIEKFNHSLSLFDYSKAYTGRATAYYIKNDLSKAINDAEKAITLDPENAKPFFVIGNCYNDMNQLSQAHSAFNQAIKRDPEVAEFYFKRAIVLGKKQDFSGCLGDLQLAIHLDPDLYSAYYWRGVAKVNLDQDPCEDFMFAAQHNVEPAINAFNNRCR